MSRLMRQTAPENRTHLCSLRDEESSCRAGTTSGVVDHEIVHNEGDNVVLVTCADVDGTRQMQP